MTVFATSPRPLSVAFPMIVMGVNLLTNRVRFNPEAAASLHMVWTKDTGSTGCRVLKNITATGSARAGFVHRLAEALTTSNIQSYRREQWLLIWPLHCVYFVVNFSLDVNRIFSSICRYLAKLVTVYFLGILNPEIMVKRCPRGNMLQTHLLEQIRQFSHAFGFPPHVTCCPDSRIARLDNRTLVVTLITTFRCLPLFLYLMKCSVFIRTFQRFSWSSGCRKNEAIVCHKCLGPFYLRFFA